MSQLSGTPFATNACLPFRNFFFRLNEICWAISQKFLNCAWLAFTSAKLLKISFGDQTKSATEVKEAQKRHWKHTTGNWITFYYFFSETTKFFILFQISLLQEQPAAMAEFNPAQLVSERLFRQDASRPWAAGQRQLLDAAPGGWGYVHQWELPAQSQEIQTQQTETWTRVAVRATDERLRRLWDLSPVQPQISGVCSLHCLVQHTGTVVLRFRGGVFTAAVAGIFFLWKQSRSLVYASVSSNRVITLRLPRESWNEQHEPKLEFLQRDVLRVVPSCTVIASFRIWIIWFSSIRQLHPRNELFQLPAACDRILLRTSLQSTQTAVRTVVNRMKKSSVAKKILELRLLAIFTTVADSRKIFVCFFVEGNNQNVYCFCPFTVFPKRLRCTACNREGYWRPTRDVEKLFRWYEQFASRNKKKNFCSRKHPTTISEHTNKLRSCWKPKKSSHANLSLNSGTKVWC